MLTLLLSVWLTLPSPTPAPAARADDEPAFNGRTLSQWLVLLKEDALPRKRQAAVVALGVLAGSREGAAPAMTAVGRALQVDASPAVREQAAAVVGQQSAETAALALGELTAAMRQEKVPAVRREVAASLAKLGRLARGAVPALAAGLDDPDAGVQAAAADALGRVGPDARPAAPALVKLAAQTNPALRQAAVFALGRVDPEDRAAAAGALVAAAQDRPSPEMLREAITALGLLGEATPGALDLLKLHLPAADAPLRVLVLQTIGRFGPAARPLQAELLGRLGAEADKVARENVVRAAFRVLGDQAAGELPRFLERLAKDPEVEVRVAIAQELGALGAAGQDALPALRQAQRDPQVPVREAAAAAARQVQRALTPPKK